jgi:hypothetical protein
MTSTQRSPPWLALLVLGDHVWLAPFAHDDPPDPLWIGGVFDGADYDDVELLVMAMTAVVDTRPVFEAPTEDAIVVAAVPQPTYHPLPTRVRPIRAPPTV